MTFILLFIIATAALITLFLIKIRAMKKNPDLYIDRLEKSNDWFTLHPETLEKKMRGMTDNVIKPTLHKSLVVGFALYKNGNIALTKFMRKKFYAMLHYSLKRNEQKQAPTSKRLRDVHEGNQ